MAPYVFCAILQIVVSRIADVLCYSDDLTFALVLNFRDGTDVARNATHILFELTQLGLPVNQKIQVAGSPLHLLGLIVNLKTKKVLPQATAMAKMFVLLLQICEARQASYHQVEQLVSMCRWCLQTPITHILDLLYDLMKVQRLQHNITFDSPTKVRKRAIFPVSTRLLHSITEVMLHLLNKVQTFKDPTPTLQEFDWTLAPDSNPAVAAGHVYAAENLKKPKHVVSTPLWLQHQASRPESMHAYKNSMLDESQGVLVTLRELEAKESPPENTRIKTFGDNEGLVSLLQRRKKSRNSYVTTVLHKIYNFIDRKNWWVEFEWRRRTDHYMKLIDRQGRLPTVHPTLRLLTTIQQKHNTKLFVPEITDVVPTWPAFPTSEFWKKFSPPTSQHKTLFLFPVQLTIQAIEMLLISFQTCPFEVLVGGPAARFGRVRKLLQPTVTRHALTAANFKHLKKKTHLKYFIGPPLY